MGRIVGKIFWRIILPFILALVIAIVTVMDMNGRVRMRFLGGGGSLDGAAVLFCVLLAINFWRTLRWGKEAEDFESHLKDAEEIERERQRRSNWIRR